MPSLRLLLLAALVTIALLTTDAWTQTNATIIESEGQAEVEVPPDEAGFRLERIFSGPTLIDGMKQVRAFERSVSQGISDLEIAIGRQESVRVRVRQRASQLEATLLLWIPITQTSGGGTAQADVLVEAAERVRKLAVSVSANATFAGYAVTDREPHEQEAVARASESALYLADAAGALAQRQVVDVERLTILETRWEGLAEPQDDTMAIPPEVKCRARVRIAYRYESGGAQR